MAGNSVLASAGLVVALVVMGCSGGDGGNDGKGLNCVDLDEDGYGDDCRRGLDCDDADENNWASCATCLDFDVDSSFAGCDQYVSIAGPDCDDADIDNQTSCATCLDGDGDSSFVGCGAYTVRAGPDCNDADADNQSACATCLDADGDSSFVGCDAYTVRAGPDCDDADIDNQTSCATCLDGDGDSSFVGCDAYTVRAGPDCSDADTDNQTSCATCLDGDGDASFVGCDQYAVRSGPDCDDVDPEAFPGAAALDNATACMRDSDGDDYGDTSAPTGGVAGTDCDDDDENNFASCASCADGDLDLSYASCDAYVSLPGPDCDDADPLMSSIEPELADDGIDNDCSGADLTAAPGGGVYVDSANVDCTNGAGAGSQASPYCGLAQAIADSATGADLFVAAGSYTMNDVVQVGTGPLRIFGGYDASWNRDIATNVTTIDTTGLVNVGLTYSGPSFVLEGVVWDGAAIGGDRELILSTSETTAIVDSHFDLQSGSAPKIDLPTLGGGGGSLANHVVVRGNTFQANAAFEVLHTNSNETFLLENNDFVLFGTGNHWGTQSRSKRDFIINNTYYLHGAGSISVYGALFADGVSYVVGNSVARNASNAPYFQIRNAEVVLLNNATFTTINAGLFATFRSSPTPTDVQVLHNVALTGSSTFGVIRATGFSEALSTATDANACVICSSASGNQNGDMLFANPAAGDFSVGAASPGIDAGIDPTPFVPYFRIYEDQLGTARPQDGNGIGGAQWDVGAIER